MGTEKVIVAQYEADWVPPYSTLEGGIPVVIASTHPKYYPGVRFDWGFLQVAVAQGYTIVILPTGKEMSNSERRIYGEAEPIEVGK